MGMVFLRWLSSQAPQKLNKKNIKELLDPSASWMQHPLEGRNDLTMTPSLLHEKPTRRGVQLIHGVWLGV